MPDENKLAKLREIGARFVETCATCIYIRSRAGGQYVAVWDDCSRHDYQHAKHGRRQVRVHALMSCNGYKRDNAVGAELAGDLSGLLPVVSTPDRAWVCCGHCGWQGWSADIVLHELDAGGSLFRSRLCPGCKNEIERVTDVCTKVGS